MRVYVVPADAYGCGHYRLIWPADVLHKAHGVNVSVIPPNGKSGFLAKVEEEPGKKPILKSVTIPEDADVIVLQRPAHPLQPQMIKMMRSNGVAVIVDMDDDMSSIHPKNIAYETYHTRSSSPFSWRHATESCKEATLVTTSTSQLQKVYARHGRGVVLDNYVPSAYLKFHKQETGNFGWPGTTSSHPDDLQATGDAVKRLIGDGHDFRVVGGQSKVREALRLDAEPTFTGAVGPEAWARTIAQTLDVGMAPLSSTAFNTSKSRLKAIELMSVGVPWVGSPRAEYRRVNRESGCGLLADTPREWYSKLKQLLTDDVLRKEQAEAGREWMQQQTYEAKSWLWLEAWEQALKIQRGSSNS